MVRDRILLAVGFFALTGAIVGAHRSPASGYELSLYSHTPTVVWVLLGLAISLSLAVAVATASIWTRRVSLGLGAGSTLAVVGMPVLRGYWFISGGDAHTHLGWARGMAAADFHPAELRYPGLHTTTILVERILGIGLEQAMMLVILALCGLFVVFVSLSTSRVVDSHRSVAIGVFSACLFLPITNLSTFTTPHPMTQAILVSSFVVYLLLRYIRTERSVSALGGLLALSLLSLVLYHPQLAAHLLVVFVGISLVQFYHRRVRPSHPVASHRPVYGQTVFLGGAFLVWSMGHDVIQNVIGFHLTSTFEYFVGDGGSAGDSVDAQGDSLTAIGGSVAEVGLKLLGPALVFCLLTAAVVVWLWLDVGDRFRRETDGMIHYFVVGLIGLSGLFGIYFFGSAGQMYFRVLGLMMLFITIIGAVAITYAADTVSRITGSTAVHGALGVGFAILLVVSLLALYPSPYVYNPSTHVTEGSMSGHELALESTPADATFVGIRAGPNRFADATDPQLDRTKRHGAITGEEIDDGIASIYDEPRYLSVTRLDWEREVRTYQGLRYSDEQIESIPRQVGVNRIQTNGDVTIYYVDGQQA